MHSPPWETGSTRSETDPKLRAAAAGLGGIPDDGKDGRLHGDKDTLGIAGPLVDVPLEDLEQRFTTVVKVQSRLATTHAKLFTHVLGLVAYVLGEHRQNRQSETPNSVLSTIKLW